MRRRLQGKDRKLAWGEGLGVLLVMAFLRPAAASVECVA